MRIGKIILVIIFVGGVFFFGLDPALKRHDALKQQKELLNQSVERADQLETKRNELINSYSQFSLQDKASLEYLLPDAVDNVRLIVDMNSIARDKNRGIIISNIAISGLDTELTSSKEKQNSEEIKNKARNQNILNTLDTQDKLGVVTLSFTITSTYENFKSFMQDLEKSLRLVDIVALDITKGEQSLNSYSITLNTYWLR
jgi:hypothetical protein